MQACGQCAACRWLAAGNHPDFRRVSPGGDENEAGEDGGASNKTEEKKARSSNIRIEQIRALEDFVFVGSHRQSNRVVLITEAEAMPLGMPMHCLKYLKNHRQVFISY